MSRLKVGLRDLMVADVQKCVGRFLGFWVFLSTFLFFVFIESGYFRKREGDARTGAGFADDDVMIQVVSLQALCRTPQTASGIW